MTNLHFTFSGLSLGSRLCIQSLKSKSRQNRFATKITGESVLNNLVDLQMFGKQVVKSVQSALSDLKRPPERLQSQCNYRLFIT